MSSRPYPVPARLPARLLLLEERRKERVVVCAEIAGPVVRQEVCARGRIVEIEHGGREVLPAQRGGGTAQMVPGHDKAACSAGPRPGAAGRTAAGSR